MPFCPNCKFEYKPEVKFCPDCGEALVAELTSQEETEEPINYVQLRRVPSRLYAEMLQEALKKQSIPCLIQAEDAGLMLGTLGTATTLKVVIWVPQKLKAKAEEIAFQILGEI